MDVPVLSRSPNSGEPALTSWMAPVSQAAVNATGDLAGGAAERVGGVARWSGIDARRTGEWLLPE